jgi:hypothetical protein
MRRFLVAVLALSALVAPAHAGGTRCGVVRGASGGPFPALDVRAVEGWVTRTTVTVTLTVGTTDPAVDPVGTKLGSWYVAYKIGATQYARWHHSGAHDVVVTPTSYTWTARNPGVSVGATCSLTGYSQVADVTIDQV